MKHDNSVLRSPATEARFSPTHWSVVLPASGQTAGAAEALERLCKIYWPPIYAFLRKQGRSPHDAQDLTQGFFAHLLAKEDRLRAVSPAKGLFRTFLLQCLKNYLRNEWDKNHAAKRGSGRILEPIIISGPDAETWYAEPADSDDPEKIFERNWAKALLNNVLRALKRQYADAGKGRVFEALHPFLTGGAGRGGYASAAGALGISEGAARTAATRLRNDYRETLRAEVSRTVSRPEEIEEEVRQLFRALSAR